jgi:hypothetical protein
MSIRKKLNQKQTGTMLFVLAGGLILIGIGVFSTYPKPTMLNTLNQDEVIDGSFVVLSEFAPLVEYATQTIKDTEYTHIIIAVKDKDEDILLMGLRVTTSEADSIWGYVDDGTPEAEWIDDLPYFGKIATIPSEGMVYFQDGLDKLGFASDFPVLSVSLDARSERYDPDVDDTLFVRIMQILMGISFLILPVLFFTGFFEKLVLRKVKTKVMDGDAGQWFSAFEASATNIHGVYLSNDALMFPTPRGSQLVFADEVVWAYGKELDTTLSLVIKTATNYFVVLRTLDKKTFMIYFRSKQEADSLLETLQTQWQNVVWGYNKNLEKVYKADPGSFVQAVHAAETKV